MRKVMLVLAVAALAVLGTSCNQLKARDQLNKGVQAFTAAQYPEAVERFKTAVELDPGFSAARLYLADDLVVEPRVLAALPAATLPTELAELSRRRVILDLPMRYY